MNERIQELYKEATSKDWAYDFDPQIAEKFAELIVRECIDTVLDSSVEYCTRPQIASEIKQHFGVE